MITQTLEFLKGPLDLLVLILSFSQRVAHVGLLKLFLLRCEDKMR